MDGVASVNGRILPLAEASVPLCDRGFLFGHAVFETLLVLGGRVVFWGEHFERLRAGCSATRIVLPPEAVLWEQCAALVRAGIAHSGRVADKMQLRLMVSGGVSPLLWDDAAAAGFTPTVAMFCRVISGLPESAYTEGWRLGLMPEERSTSMVGIKSCNYLLPMLALARAREAGLDDALFVNEAGEITESTTASFFWQGDDMVFRTSPTQERCLPGTTMLGIKRGLLRNQKPFREEILLASELDRVRGAWVASATRGAVPVRAIGDVLFSTPDFSETTQFLNEILLHEQRTTSIGVG
jgi:branched-subunit amino acid aminotransferase/4-amino-4-deoxychorismate lyase